MKKLIFLLLLSLYYSLVFSQNPVITGQIESPTVDSIYLSNINGAFYSEKIDSNGFFSFIIDSKSRGFYNLVYNKHQFVISIAENDTIEMKIRNKGTEAFLEYTKSKNMDYNKALLRLAKGKSAPDFTLKDTNGDSISLRDFKGKYVYLKIWSATCSPCIKEIPYFKKLKEDFKGKEIAFIEISRDRDEKKWKKVLARRKMNGTQLINPEPKSDFSHKYLNYGAPRYVLIDKEQKFINANAPKPSKIRDVLKKLVPDKDLVNQKEE